MLENRINLAKDFLSDTGMIFVRCDNNGNHIVRMILDKVFGEDNFRNEIIINRFQKKFRWADEYYRKFVFLY